MNTFKCTILHWWHSIVHNMHLYDLRITPAIWTHSASCFENLFFSQFQLPLAIYKIEFQNKVTWTFALRILSRNHKSGSMQQKFRKKSNIQLLLCYRSKVLSAWQNIYYISSMIKQQYIQLHTSCFEIPINIYNIYS